MAAMYIYQALKDRGYDVFYDVEVLRSGKFNDALLKEIHECKDFIIILSPHALDRCDDPKDWVRLEIAEALQEKKNIVPIIMSGFRFPEFLPKDIDEVRFLTGVNSTSEYFQESMDRLETFLVSRKKKKWILPVLIVCVIVFAAVGVVVSGVFKSELPEPSSSLVVPSSSVPSSPTPIETPAAVPTSTPEVLNSSERLVKEELASKKPDVDDLLRFNPDVSVPDSNEFLDEYEIKIVQSDTANLAAYCFTNLLIGNSQDDNYILVENGTDVVVVARNQYDYSCVLVPSKNFAGWVSNQWLKDH